MSENINKKQIEKIANKSEEVGDSCLKRYNSSKKLEFAKVGIAAYRNALYANNLLIKSQKL